MQGLVVLASHSNFHWLSIFVWQLKNIVVILLHAAQEFVNLHFLFCNICKSVHHFYLCLQSDQAQTLHAALEMVYSASFGILMTFVSDGSCYEKQAVCECFGLLCMPALFYHCQTVCAAL